MQFDMHGMNKVVSIEVPCMMARVNLYT